MIICIVSAAMMCGNLCGCCGAKDDFAAVFVSVPTSVQSGSAAPTQQVCGRLMGLALIAFNNILELPLHLR